MAPFPQSSELPLLLEDQMQKHFFIFVFSAHNMGHGQALKKNLWSKQIHGRKTIWTNVHLQSLLGTLFAGYMP